ncbi:MAG: hypothetical protein ACRC31_06185 [Cetobacterium sp.]
MDLNKVVYSNRLDEKDKSIPKMESKKFQLQKNKLDKTNKVEKFDKEKEMEA